LGHIRINLGSIFITQTAVSKNITQTMEREEIEMAVDQVEISSDEERGPKKRKRDEITASTETGPEDHENGVHPDGGAIVFANRDTSEAMKRRVAHQMDYYFSMDNLFFDKWLKEKVLQAQEMNNGCSHCLQHV
jgi:hypothetical protein